MRRQPNPANVASNLGVQVQLQTETLLTNGTVVDPDHPRVPCGRHYRDATPTSGTIYRGGGGEQLFVDVQVQALETLDEALEAFEAAGQDAAEP